MTSKKKLLAKQKRDIKKYMRDEKEEVYNITSDKYTLPLENIIVYRLFQQRFITNILVMCSIIVLAVILLMVYLK